MSSSITSIGNSNTLEILGESVERLLAKAELSSGHDMRSAAETASVLMKDFILRARKAQEALTEARAQAAEAMAAAQSSAADAEAAARQAIQNVLEAASDATQMAADARAALTRVGETPGAAAEAARRAAEQALAAAEAIMKEAQALAQQLAQFARTLALDALTRERLLTLAAGDRTSDLPQGAQPGARGALEVKSLVVLPQGGAGELGQAQPRTNAEASPGTDALRQLIDSAPLPEALRPRAERLLTALSEIDMLEASGQTSVAARVREAWLPYTQSLLQDLGGTLLAAPAVTRPATATSDQPAGAGIYGTPMPVGVDGKTFPERGHYLDEAERERNLEWLRYNAEPGSTAALLTPNYVGPPEYQAHVARIAAESAAFHAAHPEVPVPVIGPGPAPSSASASATTIKISYPDADRYWAAVNAGRDPAADERAYNLANPGTPKTNKPYDALINGIYYKVMERPNGDVYSARVNPDGTPWVDSTPARTQAEIASGIGMVGDSGSGANYRSPALKASAESTTLSAPPPAQAASPDLERGQALYEEFLRNRHWKTSADRALGLAYAGARGIGPFGHLAIDESGRSVGTYDAQGNIVPFKQTDWAAEAAAGRPVPGPAVAPSSSTRPG